MRGVVAKKTEYLSIIDQGLTINGEVSSKGEIVVRGVLKGTLEGEKVVIAAEGAVYAKATVEDIIISGSFEGAIRASKSLTIRDKGACLGKVVCKHLIVEAGGNLNAEVSYIEDSNGKS